MVTLIEELLPWVMFDSPRFNIYLTMLFLGFLYGLKNYLNLGSHFKALVLYLGFSFISEFISRILKVEFANSMPIYHFLIPIQFLFFGYFYSKLFKKNASLIISIAISFSIISGFITIIVQTLDKFPTYSFLILLLFVIVLALFNFKKMISDQNSIVICQTPVFWFNISGLIFFSTTLFFFGFKNVFNFKNDYYNWLTYGITILSYVFYIYSIHLEKKLFST